MNHCVRFLRSATAIRTASFYRYCASEASTSQIPASEVSKNIIITDKCVQQLKRVAAPNEHLRVLVDGGGCSGFEYKFELDSTIRSDDHVFEKDGVKVLVDRLSLDFLAGATIDYQTELIKAAFRVTDNPQAEAGCSCGASFALKM